MPQHLLFQIALYIACFALVWVGSGLVVSSASSLARSWKLPTFIVSFFLLGILTSLPEITIGTAAIMRDDPSIIVGNLLGGVIIILLGIIPLLGIVGNGVTIPSQLGKKQLLYTLIVILAPAFLTADQRIEKWEGVFFILLYASLFVFFSFRQSFLGKVKTALGRKKKNWFGMLGKIALGMIILVAASSQIVNSTIYFSELLNISPFFVSLIIVALGTNIPEISIIFRSVISNKKGVALADYLGSASASTLLFGIFAVVYGQDILLPNHFLQRFAFLALGSILLFIFARSKNFLSRAESLVLFSVYVGFMVFEIVFMKVLG